MFRWHTLFLCLCFVCLSLFFSACSSPPPITSTELTIYSFTEYIPADLLSQFEQAVAVKVTLDTYSSNEEMLAGLAANPGRYDILIPSDYTVEILIKQDALQPLDLARIPNYSNIQTAFLSPYFDPGGVTSRPGARKQKYSLPYQWGTTGIAYDSSKVSQPISRWEDLWRPDLAGHLVTLDDSRELMGLALLSLGYDKNSTDVTQLEAARDKLKQLTPGIIAFDSDVPESYLLSGEAWAGVVFSGNAALASRANSNMVYVFPEEGAGIWFDNLVIPLDAPHSDAAYAFINYVLAPETGVLITRDFPYSNPNETAVDYMQENDPALYQAYVGSPITNPSPDVLAGARLVKNVGVETAVLYEQYWAEAKGQ